MYLPSRTRWLVTGCLAVLSLQGCQDKFLPQEYNGPSHLPHEATALSLRFEVEAVTYRETLSPPTHESFTFLDEIAAEPVVSRQAVQMNVSANGSTEWLIEERAPKIVIIPDKSEVPPSDIAPIVKTHIVNGQARFYDATGKLVYEHPMEEDYALIDQLMQMAEGKDLVAAARAEGGQLETLENGLVKVTKQLPPTEQDPALRTSNSYIEDLIDPGLNLLVGSSLNEGNGKLLCRIANKHKQVDGKWQLEMRYQEDYGISEATGSEYVAKTTYYFEDYTLEHN